MWMPLGIKIDGKRKKNITGTNGLELKKKKKKKKKKTTVTRRLITINNEEKML